MHPKLYLINRSHPNSAYAPIHQTVYTALNYFKDSTRSLPCPLNITIFPFLKPLPLPLFCTHSFYFNTFSFNSPILSAINTKSFACNSSGDSPSLASRVSTSRTATNSNGLRSPMYHGLYHRSLMFSCCVFHCPGIIIYCHYRMRLTQL